MKTIKDFLEKNYDYVEMRFALPGWGKERSLEEKQREAFAGAFSICNGKISSLDGDTYPKDDEVLWYEEWKNEEKGIKNGLTLVVKTNWTRNGET